MKFCPFSYGTTNIWYNYYPCRKSGVPPSDKGRRLGWQAELQTRGIRAIPETAPNGISIGLKRTSSDQAHYLAAWLVDAQYSKVPACEGHHHLPPLNKWK